MNARRVAAWSLLAVEAFLYVTFVLMVLHAFGPGEDDTEASIFVGPIFLLPAIAVTVIRTRVLRLRLRKGEAQPPAPPAR